MFNLSGLARHRGGNGKPDTDESKRQVRLRIVPRSQTKPSIKIIKFEFGSQLLNDLEWGLNPRVHIGIEDDGSYLTITKSDDGFGLKVSREKDSATGRCAQLYRRYCQETGKKNPLKDEDCDIYLDYKIDNAGAIRAELPEEFWQVA